MGITVKFKEPIKREAKLGQLIKHNNGQIGLVIKIGNSLNYDYGVLIMYDSETCDIHEVPTRYPSSMSQGTWLKKNVELFDGTITIKN